MKLQYMIVIFIVVVLPISLVLSYYTDLQIESMVMQVSYDTKLTDATHDAAAALHTNIMNNGSQATIYNVMRENVLAATNVFMNSIATSLGVGGYSEDELKQHIPAIVYTMYDGYYIYTPYKEFANDGGEQRTLKPYVYYTKRYTEGDVDITVNYSLDNYIAIYGKKGNNSIAKSGYLINPSDVVIENDGSIKYKNYSIEKENGNKVFYRYSLEQTEDINTTPATYNYNVQGALIYKEAQEEINEAANEGRTLTEEETEQGKHENAAKNYYKEAKEFTDFVKANFANLSNGDGKKIFDISSDNNPENDDSVFNQERTEVIKDSIEDNLKIAISNFNQTNPGTANYSIPEIDFKDWDTIYNNFSVIAYMEGIKSGFKEYNSYAITPLASNNLYVNKNDIYFKGNDKYYHRSTCDKIDESSEVIGYPGYNFTKIGQDFTENNKIITKYFYLKNFPACYYCAINNMTGTNENDAIGNHPKEYYTALARERQLTYKTSKRITDIVSRIQ